MTLPPPRLRVPPPTVAERFTAIMVRAGYWFEPIGYVVAGTVFAWIFASALLRVLK